MIGFIALTFPGHELSCVAVAPPIYSLVLGHDRPSDTALGRCCRSAGIRGPRAWKPL